MKNRTGSPADTRSFHERYAEMAAAENKALANPENIKRLLDELRGMSTATIDYVHSLPGARWEPGKPPRLVPIQTLALVLASRETLRAEGSSAREPWDRLKDYTHTLAKLVDQLRMAIAAGEVTCFHQDGLPFPPPNAFPLMSEEAQARRRLQVIGHFITFSAAIERGDVKSALQALGYKWADEAGTKVADSRRPGWPLIEERHGVWSESVEKHTMVDLELFVRWAESGPRRLALPGEISIFLAHLHGGEATNALPVPRLRAQENAILEILRRDLHLDPVALPRASRNGGGPKASSWKIASRQTAIFQSRGVFDKAWDRLRSDSRVAEAV